MNHVFPQIEIKNISMRYQNASGAPIQALQKINFDIYKGEFISLLGPSGCGKSTLLRIVADLLKPTEGKVFIGGLTPKEARLEKTYGMVFQSPVLYDWRTVRKNICLPLELMGMKHKEQIERANEMLDMVGLLDYANYYPYQLSGGMQQRVGIARALALDPRILLMDEPFSALDEFTRQKLNEDLLNIWSKTNKTVIFVTHNIEEAVFLSDRVCVLSPHPGRLSSVVDITLPRPRTKELRYSRECQELVAYTRSCFEEV
jgi:NitT/TauT family transport system ATP-binding protein